MRQFPRRRLTLLSFLLLTVVSGCASIRPPVLDTQSDPFLIMFEELHGAPYSSAYEAVEDLRPNWIRPGARRVPGGALDITVYLDKVHLGTLQSLMSVPTGSLEVIEWVDPATATERWGRDHATPVIEVRTTP